MGKNLRDKLKIAVLGTASLPIPPFGGYGGTQRGIYDFIKHLDKRGHNIDLYGPGDSDISELNNTKLHYFTKKSLWIEENNLSVEKKKELSQEHYLKSINKIKKRDKKNHYDIINFRSDNLDILEMLTNEFGKERIVYSLHNVRNQSRVEKIAELGIVSIAHCRSHKREHSDLPNIHVITYGIDVATYPYSGKSLSNSQENPVLEVLKKLKENNQDYLLNLGAIGKHKGQKTAIELAKETKNNLIIAGTAQDRTGNEKQRYFDKFVKPQIDNSQIIYFGNANEEQKKELMKFSKAFLFPSGYEQNTWTEPFGRAPVESLSCGSPVIAYRKGSMEEVIIPRFNGNLFENFEEAIHQIKNIDKISREDSRRTAQILFNSSRVADEYEELFYKMKNEDSI